MGTQKSGHGSNKLLSCYSNLENIARLEEALSGEAAACVSNLMIGAANIPKVLETFGKLEIVYRQLMSDLVKTINSNRTNLVKISEDLDSLVTNMETKKKKDFLHDRLIYKFSGRN